LPFRPTFWPTVFTVPAILLMIGLSIWQVQRLHWKEGLIAERVGRTQAEPIALPAPGADLTNLEFRKVALQGTFDHAHEFYLAARSMNGNVGYWIVTPFHLESGPTVLINRGWVPENKKLPASRPEGQVAGSISQIGVIRLPQTQTWFQPDNEPDRNIWFYLAPVEMAKAGNLDLRTDLYLDADPAANPGGYPIGGQTQINLPNDHLQYSITWALLAISLAVIYVVYHLKLERERRPQ
jgi:surfeit locus 1 family protein